MMRPNSPARSVTKPGQKQDEKKLEPQEQARKKKQEKLKWNTSKKIDEENPPHFHTDQFTRLSERRSHNFPLEDENKARRYGQD